MSLPPLTMITTEQFPLKRRQITKWRVIPSTFHNNARSSNFGDHGYQWLAISAAQASGIWTKCCSVCDLENFDLFDFEKFLTRANFDLEIFFQILLLPLDHSALATKCSNEGNARFGMRENSRTPSTSRVRKWILGVSTFIQSRMRFCHTVVHEITFLHEITFRPKIWHFLFARISRWIAIKSRSM
jgi:hypothetical protein